VKPAAGYHEATVARSYSHWQSLDWPSPAVKLVAGHHEATVARTSVLRPELPYWAFCNEQGLSIQYYKAINDTFLHAGGY
jgi:hypothetical protein